MSNPGKKDNRPATKDSKQEQKVENPGNYLRTLRIGKGLSVKDVSEATHISGTNLNAIEDQNFPSLPASTFTRGLLNIYANFLGADAETVTVQFMEEREKFLSQKQRSRPKQSYTILKPKRLAEPSHISSVTMAGALLLLIVVTFTGYCVYTSWNPFSFLMKKNGNIVLTMKNVFPDKKSSPASPDRENFIIVSSNQPSREIMTVPQPFQEVSSTSVIEPEEDNISQKSNGLEQKYTVSLRFLENTSIKLTRDDDETVVQEFKAGDVRSWSAGSSLTLIFAQPDSAEILVNDSTVPFPEAQDGSYTLHIPQDTAPLHQDE